MSACNGTRPGRRQGHTELRVNDKEQKREQRIRERAYFLWQNDGCPVGQADRYWERAREIEAAYQRDDRRVDIEGEDSFPASDPPSRSGVTGSSH